jgi:hypothetical protein
LDERVILTVKVDVWVFGLILYEILVGLAVFPSSLTPFDVIRRMRSQYRPIIPEHCGEYMKGLIERCWCEDPAFRPTFDEILGEFGSRQFDIMPGADCHEIRVAVDDVVKWEFDAGLSSP